MPNKDYYQVLGLSKTATDEEIKRAYRKLAQEHHPDKGGNHERFKEINEAYQVLKDPEKRSSYDRFGDSPFQGFNNQGASGFGGFDFNDVNVEFSDFSGGGFGDIFDIFFGGGGRSKARNERGTDIEVSVNISFEESVSGVIKDIYLDRVNMCSQCHGTGSEPGSNLRTCLNCGGGGYINQTKRTILGSINQSALCSHCKGQGKIPEKFCKTCGGDKKVKTKTTIKVKIPAGIKSGSRILMRGEGNAGDAGSANGDLYIFVIVEPSKRFTRENDDIIAVEEIDFVDAALGASRDVETVFDKERITVKPGTQSGDEIVIRGKGFTNQETGRRGNHVIRLKVSIPKHLSRKQKKLLEEFKNSGGFLL